MRLRLQRVGLIGLVLLICMTVAVPSAAAAELEVKPAHVPPPRPSQSDPRVAELEAEGYGLSDILTALDFEWKTGVAPEVWLEKYDEAGQWLDVARQTQEMGVSLQNPWRSSSELTVEESTRNQYQDQGYSLLEVFEAAGLARDFGITMDDAFALFHERGGMRGAERHLIELAERAVRGPVHKCGFGGWVGEKGEVHTTDPKTGTTVTQICTWTAKGYEFKDVVEAFSQSTYLQATMEELLSMRSQGMSWQTIVNIIPFTESTFAEQTGLEIERVRNLMRQGFTQIDIRNAQFWAKEMYLTVEQVLQEFDEKGRDWAEYLVLNPTPANVALTLGWPLERVLEYVKRGAKPLWILQADYRERNDGLPFDVSLDAMIKNNSIRRTIPKSGAKAQAAAKEDPESYEELRKLLKVPPAVWIIFSTDEFNKLRAMGFDDEEIAKIGLIAKGLKHPAMDVAIMKRSGIGWLDLINRLKKKR